MPSGADARFSESPTRSAAVAAVGWLLSLIAVATGLADRAYAAIAPPLPWRTGPAGWAVFVYLAAFAGAWLAVTAGAAALLRLRRDLSLVRAGVLLVTSSTIVALQVLMPYRWLFAWVACTLAMSAATAYLAPLLGQPRPRPIAWLLAWGWTSAGLWLAQVVVHPYFAGQPTFIPRAVLVTTPWVAVGIVVARRMRLEPPHRSPRWTPDLLP
ncbi:MAG TPA: hypothetical protein VER17_07605 [Tepidisphaeraceae bacterium]|nr:hypothetical protein [Tepidisphaeraceae bacterium]